MKNNGTENSTEPIFEGLKKKTVNSTRNIDFIFKIHLCVQKITWWETESHLIKKNYKWEVYTSWTELNEIRKADQKWQSELKTEFFFSFKMKWATLRRVNDQQKPKINSNKNNGIPKKCHFFFGKIGVKLDIELKAIWKAANRLFERIFLISNFWFFFGWFPINSIILRLLRRRAIMLDTC